MPVPENAARNADGSLQNPAAWGISPGNGVQPGSYDPNNAPKVDWEQLNKSGFGGLYNGMAENERAQILANSQRNFERTGVLDSNLSGYLNNRDTARGMGLVGANNELDMNNLFGGLGEQQNLSFGPDKLGVSFQDASQGATSNIARVMQALGGGGYSNLGANMDGFNGGTPQYGVFGGQSARGIQETLLRNGLSGGLGMLSASLPTGRFEGANPASTRYDQTNFNYAGPRSVTPPPGAATTPGAPVNPTQPSQPGANPTTGYGVSGPQAPNAAPPPPQSGMPAPPAWNPADPVGSTQKLIAFQQQMTQWAQGLGGAGGGQAPGGAASQTTIDNGPQMVQTGGGDNPYNANQSQYGNGYQGSSGNQNGFGFYNGGNPFQQGGGGGNAWGIGGGGNSPTAPNASPWGQASPSPSTDPGGGVRAPGTPTTPATTRGTSGTTDSGAWGGRRSNNWLWGM